ncbi:hypothetical protein F52700_4484 [Fusarium sp. NRRL 52700]|nr:hypothetical protein F52700_4484 [Fusarium sp. NRRL 52700]
MTLLSLYIAQVRWVNPSTESLNGLQFAAKGHETLILVSLGDILLHQVSYGLKRQEVGAPLGFLSSPLNLSAPLRYLISRQLWAPTLQCGKIAQYRRTTACLIMLISILCLAESPLSAIAMIPRKDWWKDHHYDWTILGGSYDEPARLIPHIAYRTMLDSASGPYFRDAIGPYTFHFNYPFSADLRKNLMVTFALDKDDPVFAELRDRNSTDYRFLDLASDEDSLVSGNVLFATTGEFSGDEEPELKYTLCLIFARWSEAKPWIEQPARSRTLSHLKEPILDSLQKNSIDVIYMDDEWLDGISSFSNGSFFRSIPEFCALDHTRNCIERYLGLHITDALSQAGNNFTWPNYYGKSTQADDVTQDKVVYSRYYYTYAYRFESSYGIPLAFSVLLAHVLLVLVHLITILGSKDPWQGSDWDNFGDMLVLALASKPPDGMNDLTQQSSKSEIWRKRVTVTCNGEQMHYQIRLREGNGYQRPAEEEVGL